MRNSAGELSILSVKRNVLQLKLGRFVLMLIVRKVLSQYHVINSQ